MRKHGFAALIPRVDDSANALRGKPIARGRIPLEVAAMKCVPRISVENRTLAVPGPLNHQVSDSLSTGILAFQTNQGRSLHSVPNCRSSHMLQIGKRPSFLRYRTELTLCKSLGFTR